MYYIQIKYFLLVFRVPLTPEDTPSSQVYYRTYIYSEATDAKFSHTTKLIISQVIYQLFWQMEGKKKWKGEVILVLKGFHGEGVRGECY